MGGACGIQYSWSVLRAEVAAVQHVALQTSHRDQHAQRHSQYHKVYVEIYDLESSLFWRVLRIKVRKVVWGWSIGNRGQDPGYLVIFRNA